MAKLLKLRRGSTSQHSSFTGAEGEVTVDTTKDTLVVHDGSTAGGIPLAKESAVPTTITVADESSDTSCNVLFTTAATGNLAPKSGTNLTFDSSSGILTAAGGFTGAVTGNVTGNVSGSSSSCTGNAVTATTATTATNVTLADESSDTTCFPVFATAATSDLAPKTGDNLTFNSSSGALTATSFVGNLTGNASGSSGSCTGNAVTATTATNVTVTDNENSDQNNLITFINGAAGPGDIGLGSDGDIYYNPSGGLLSVPAVTTTGNVIVGGDLWVSGNTTTINSTTLSVDDKNIELGSVSSPSDTTADGGGITLKGATDKTINWINSTDNWTFNQNIEVTGTASAITITAGEGFNSAIYLVADEGDDNGDYWGIQSNQSDNNLYFISKTSGSYATKAIVTEEGAVHDSKGDLRKIPSQAESTAHTPSTAHVGYVIYISSGGVTFNNSTFSAGDVITVVNNSGSNQTITQGSGLTIYNSADAATGNRTLAGRGMATIWFAGASTAYISGAGLS